MGTKKEINMGTKKKINKNILVPIQEESKMPRYPKLTDLDYPVFLLSFPTHLSVDKPNNVWMNKQEILDLGPLDVDLAWKQWLDFYSSLAQTALIYILPAREGLQDQTYTANLGITLPNHISKGTYILSNFRSRPRIGEEQEGRRFLSDLGYNVIQSPYFFEGEAELKYIAGNLFAGGYGIRTSKKAYDWMEKQFGMEIIKCYCSDQELYHFDCVFASLYKDQAIVCTELLEPSAVKKLEKHVNIYSIDKELAKTGITNLVRNSGMCYIHSDISDLSEEDGEYYQNEKRKVSTFEKICGDAGLEPVIVDISEFGKSGALLSCCTCRLNYVGY